MAILDIVKYPNEILAAKARDLTDNEILTSEVQTLIEDMIDTCHHHNGLGLAACQVGSDANVCIYKDKVYKAIINPKIIARMGKMTVRDEACLSISDQSFTVKRSKQIIVRGLDRDGEGINIKTSNKLMSKILQHEVDHLNGITLADKGKRTE